MGERGVEIIGAGSNGDASRALERDDLQRGEILDMLADRGNTHGLYKKQADVAQKIKAIWEDTPNWSRLDTAERESLHMIAAKISRILCGNPKCKDHWADIAGYAQLVISDD